MAVKPPKITKWYMARNFNSDQPSTDFFTMWMLRLQRVHDSTGANPYIGMHSVEDTLWRAGYLEDVDNFAHLERGLIKMIIPEPPESGYVAERVILYLPIDRYHTFAGEGPIVEPPPYLEPWFLGDVKDLDLRVLHCRRPVIFPNRQMGYKLSSDYLKWKNFMGASWEGPEGILEEPAKPEKTTTSNWAGSSVSKTNTAKWSWQGGSAFPTTEDMNEGIAYAKRDLHLKYHKATSFATWPWLGIDFRDAIYRGGDEKEIVMMILDSQEKNGNQTTIDIDSVDHGSFAHRIEIHVADVAGFTTGAIATIEGLDWWYNGDAEISDIDAVNNIITLIHWDWGTRSHAECAGATITAGTAVWGRGAMITTFSQFNTSLPVGSAIGVAYPNTSGGALANCAIDGIAGGIPRPILFVVWAKKIVQTATDITGADGLSIVGTKSNKNLFTFKWTAPKDVDEFVSMQVLIVNPYYNDPEPLTGDMVVEVRDKTQEIASVPLPSIYIPGTMAWYRNITQAQNARQVFKVGSNLVLFWRPIVGSLDYSRKKDGTTPFVLGDSIYIPKSGVNGNNACLGTLTLGNKITASVNGARFFSPGDLVIVGDFPADGIPQIGEVARVASVTENLGVIMLDHAMINTYSGGDVAIGKIMGNLKSLRVFPGDGSEIVYKTEDFHSITSEFTPPIAPADPWIIAISEAWSIDVDDLVCFMNGIEPLVGKVLSRTTETITVQPIAPWDTKKFKLYNGTQAYVIREHIYSQAGSFQTGAEAEIDNDIFSIPINSKAWNVGTHVWDPVTISILDVAPAASIEAESNFYEPQQTRRFFGHRSAIFSSDQYIGDGTRKMYWFKRYNPLSPPPNPVPGGALNGWVETNAPIFDWVPTPDDTFTDVVAYSRNIADITPIVGSIAIQTGSGAVHYNPGDSVLVQGTIGYNGTWTVISSDATTVYIDAPDNGPEGIAGTISNVTPGCTILELEGVPSPAAYAIGSKIILRGTANHDGEWTVHNNVGILLTLIDGVGYHGDETIAGQIYIAGPCNVALKVWNGTALSAVDYTTITISDEVIGGTFDDIVDLADLVDGYISEEVTGGREVSISASPNDVVSADSLSKTIRDFQISGHAHTEHPVHPIAKVEAWKIAQGIAGQGLPDDLLTLLYIENHRCVIRFDHEGKLATGLMVELSRNREHGFVEQRDWTLSIKVLTW